MFDYIQKFKGLPKDVYDKLTDKKTTDAIDRLEKKFSVGLAKLVMLVAIKEVPLTELEKYISSEFNLDLSRAKMLAADLEADVFSSVAIYLKSQALEIKAESRAIADNQPVIAPPVSKAAVKPAETPLPVKEASKALIVEEPALPAVRPTDNFSSSRPVNANSTAPSPIPAAQPGAANRPPARRASSFFFSPEDEEEINALSNKVIDYLGNNSVRSNTQENLDNIAKAFSTSFTSHDAIHRLKQIMRTYVQGIRNKLETRMTLMKDYRSGGLGIDEKLANEIILVADGKSKAPETNEPAKKILANLPASRDVDYNLKAEIEKRKEEISKLVETPTVQPPQEKTLVEKAKEEKVKKQIAEALAANTEKPKEKEIKDQVVKVAVKAVDNATQPAKPRTDSSANKKAAPAADSAVSQKPERPAPSQDEILRNVPVAVKVEAGKRKMEDVKFTPKILTPIEELKYFDLNNFRRFWKDKPEEATAKIMEKISLLEEEEYAKKLLGIKAWRESPLMRLYLEIGNEAITEKKSVADIINRRKTEGKGYLSEEEIHAIMDLNRELRF